MAAHVRDGTRKLPRRILAATMAGLPAAVAAACGGHSSSQPLPPRTAPPTVATTATSRPGDARTAVLAAFTAFWPASARAERLSPAKAEALMAPLAAQPYLGHLLSQMAAYRTRHEEQAGYAIPHVTRVHVNDSAATVYDCQDESRVHLADTRTGKAIPGTKGHARTYYIASLARGSDGRWRLTSLAQVAVKCEPSPSVSP